MSHSVSTDFRIPTQTNFNPGKNVFNEHGKGEQTCHRDTTIGIMIVKAVARNQTPVAHGAGGLRDVTDTATTKDSEKDGTAIAVMAVTTVEVINQVRVATLRHNAFAVTAAASVTTLRIATRDMAATWVATVADLTNHHVVMNVDPASRRVATAVVVMASPDKAMTNRRVVTAAAVTASRRVVTVVVVMASLDKATTNRREATAAVVTASRQDNTANHHADVTMVNRPAATGATMVSRPEAMTNFPATTSRRKDTTIQPASVLRSHAMTADEATITIAAATVKAKAVTGVAVT